MRLHLPFALLLVATVACRPEAQSRPPLPACEWCGATEAPPSLESSMRLAGSAEPGERLVVSGRIFEADGRTPAAGVLVYAYQTDATGAYAMRGDQTGNARRHGALRGWLRTAADGRYRIETIRPAPYPERNAAAHIHVTLTPVGGAEGWIESIVFADDPLLTAEERAGRGVVQLRRDDSGVLRASRDILLSEARR